MIELVKVEGTLEELKALFIQAAVAEVKKEVVKAGAQVVKKTVKRTKSAWQKFMGQKKNQIKFKSGANKGKLDLKRMSKAYKRGRKK